jgi:hypothetical protein
MSASPETLRAKNLRTGLLLGGLALAYFGALLIKYYVLNN